MKFTSSLGLTMSGSSGGCTASRNRGGQYFRRRSIPTNPNTTEQQTVRSAMTTLVAAWGALTAPQRAAWDTYATNTPGVDSLGQALVLTGQQSYIRCNTARIAAGESVVDTAPIVFNRGEPVTSLTDLDVAGSTTAGIAGGASDDGQLLVYVGRPVSVGRNFYKGPYRFMTSAAVSSGGTSGSFGIAANDPYGEAFAVGQRRPVRGLIAYSDGRVSIAFEEIRGVIDST